MKTIIHALLLSLLASGSALAQSAHDHARMGHDKMPMSAPQDEFGMLDANKDGALSEDEMARHRLGPHFAMLDANRDGKLDKAEFAAGKAM